jgi:phospholipase C
VPTRDLVHRFYQNVEQINGGRNDRFVAASDAGGLAMGYYDGSSLPLWQWAKDYVLADNFFMGAFGGSFLNHFWLVCACTPEDRDAPAARRVQLDERGWLDPTAFARLRAQRRSRVHGRRGHARRLLGQHHAAALAAVTGAPGSGR